MAEEAMRAKRPLIQLFKKKVERPVGTGPFSLKDWRQGAYIFLAKNKHFFAQGTEIEGYLLGPHIDGLLLKMFGTPDAAVLAMRKGSIDMFWWGIQAGYIEDLFKHRNIQIFSNEKSALYYLGFNTRKSPFNDIHFRHAVATLIDKDFIVRRILQGFAIKMQGIASGIVRGCPRMAKDSRERSVSAGPIKSLGKRITVGKCRRLMQRERW
jgi:ABC-type transport system substrate-binding protein